MECGSFSQAIETLALGVAMAAGMALMFCAVWVGQRLLGTKQRKDDDDGPGEA